MTSALNMTSCKGSIFGFNAPSALIDAAIPEVFEPAGEPTSAARVEFQRCAKFSVDGLDVGEGSVFFLSVVIKAPQGAPTGNHGGNWFLLEVRTDNPLVAAWIKANGPGSGNGSVSRSFDPLPDPSPYGELLASVAESGREYYAARSYPETELAAQEVIIRYYYGPDVTRDFWQTRDWVQISPGYGPGTLETASDSVLATAMNGVTRWSGLGAATETSYLLVLPRASTV